MPCKVYSKKEQTAGQKYSGTLYCSNTFLVIMRTRIHVCCIVIVSKVKVINFSQTVSTKPMSKQSVVRANQGSLIKLGISLDCQSSKEFYGNSSFEVSDATTKPCKKYD